MGSSAQGQGPWKVYFDHGRDEMLADGPEEIWAVVRSMVYRHRITNVVDRRGHDVTNAWLHPSARMDRAGTARGKTRLVARVKENKFWGGKATHYESASGQRTRLDRGAAHCSICRGPHVYKHGRP